MHSSLHARYFYHALNGLNTVLFHRLVVALSYARVRLSSAAGGVSVCLSHADNASMDVFTDREFIGDQRSYLGRRDS